MRGILLSRRAERDLRRIGRGAALDRLRAALTALAEASPSLDIKPLAGAEPWHRLRVGDYRVILRPIDLAEANDADSGWLVARVVHRRDLEPAVGTVT
jgi:mRNA-degrading endonuclease RelE of RelBE toxin-antitoxin system